MYAAVLSTHQPNLTQPNPPASPKTTEEMSFPKNYCWQTKRPNLMECLFGEICFSIKATIA